MTPAPLVTCDTLLEQISAYLDGDLSVATCATIERHAQACRKCARVINDFRRTTGLCRKAVAAPLPVQVRQLAKTRIRELMGPGVSSAETRKKGTGLRK